MNWRRVICWLRGHNWEVLEGKRHCVFCDYVPEDDDVNFCPECGSERLRLCIMVSDGYQYLECMKCGHKFHDTGDSAVTVTCSHGVYELEKPMVSQNGNPIELGKRTMKNRFNELYWHIYHVQRCAEGQCEICHELLEKSMKIVLELQKKEQEGNDNEKENAKDTQKLCSP